MERKVRKEVVYPDDYHGEIEILSVKNDKNQSVEMKRNVYEVKNCKDQEIVRKPLGSNTNNDRYFAEVKEEKDNVNIGIYKYSKKNNIVKSFNVVVQNDFILKDNMILKESIVNTIREEFELFLKIETNIDKMLAVLTIFIFNESDYLLYYTDKIVKPNYIKIRDEDIDELLDYDE